MPGHVTEQDMETAAFILRDTIALVEGEAWRTLDEAASARKSPGSTRLVVERLLIRSSMHPPTVFGGDGALYIVGRDGRVYFVEPEERFADKARAYGFTVKS